MAKKTITQNTLIITLFLLAGCKCPFCSSKQMKNQDSTVPAAASQASTIQTEPLLITTAAAFEKEVVNETRPTVVDFFANWCHYCKTSKPIFHAVAQKLGSTYKFVTVDTDQATGVAEKYGIRGLPTFGFFKNGTMMSRSTGGLSSADAFITTINAAFQGTNNK